MSRVRAHATGEGTVIAGNLDPMAIRHGGGGVILAVTTPPPQEIAPGVVLLRGAILPERGPDGNTVVFDAPEGLVVVDTGRHAWHSDAILAFARAGTRPVAAIVNTHWHLDHTSGNGRIKAASRSRGLRDECRGSRAGAGRLPRPQPRVVEPMLDDPKVSDIQKEEVKIFLAR